MTHEPTLPDAYPLQWPVGWPRTGSPRDSRYAKVGQARTGHTPMTESKIRTQLLRSVKLLGGTLPIISSNIEVRLDGLPYTNRRLPADGGIAVYWVREGKQEVMACDQWKRPWENMRAVYHAVEGLRAMERAGASQIFERAFQAFQLPAPAEKNWRDVLGHDIHTKDQALRAFRDKAKILHPDRGGDVKDFQAAEAAYRAALKELQQ